MGAAVHSPSQSAHSLIKMPALVEDGGEFKFQRLLVNNFTGRLAVLIKVKNSTQSENNLLLCPENISCTDSNSFHTLDH